MTESTMDAEDSNFYMMRSKLIEMMINHSVKVMYCFYFIMNDEKTFVEEVNQYFFNRMLLDLKCKNLNQEKNFIDYYFDDLNHAYEIYCYNQNKTPQENGLLLSTFCEFKMSIEPPITN